MNTGIEKRLTTHIDKLEFPLKETPRPGKTVQITPELRWVRMPLPFALDHVNIWLITDEHGWTSIDSGISTKINKQLWREIISGGINNDPISKIIITHYHPDHIGNASWLMETFNAPLHITLSEYLTAHAQIDSKAGHKDLFNNQLFNNHGLVSTMSSSKEKNKKTYRDFVDPLPEFFNRLIDGQNIKIGNHHWKVIVGHGHSPEHASLYCQALDVLIAGDMLLPKISTNVSITLVNPDGDPLEDFLTSLKKFKEIPDSTLILPSHGEPFRGARARVEMLENHHLARLKETEESSEISINAYELLPTMFKRKLDLHQTPFAMGEAIAHLNHLWHRGILHREIRPNNKIRFKKIK